MKNCKKRQHEKHIHKEKYLEKHLDVEVMRKKDKLEIDTTIIHKYRSAHVEGNVTYAVTSTLSVSQYRQIYPGGKSAPAQHEIEAEWVSVPVWTISKTEKSLRPTGNSTTIPWSSSPSLSCHTACVITHPIFQCHTKGFFNRMLHYKKLVNRIFRAHIKVFFKIF